MLTARLKKREGLCSSVGASPSARTPHVVNNVCRRALACDRAKRSTLFRSPNSSNDKKKEISGMHST